VRRNGEPLRLSQIEYRLLLAMAGNPGRILTHRQLLTEVWGPGAANEKQYLRVYMTHLRRKLRRKPGEPGVFETEAGVGYRLRWDPE
jgi:two-component system KDP operon response regulator KdpE